MREIWLFFPFVTKLGVGNYAFGIQTKKLTQISPPKNTWVMVKRAIIFHPTGLSFNNY